MTATNMCYNFVGFRYSLPKDSRFTTLEGFKVYYLNEGFKV